MIRRAILTAGLVVVAAALAAGGRSLWIGVPVGAGYAAKVTCSLALNSAHWVDGARLVGDEGG